MIAGMGQTNDRALQECTRLKNKPQQYRKISRKRAIIIVSPLQSLYKFSRHILNIFCIKT